MSDLTVSGLRFSHATSDDHVTGLLGFVSFLINGRLRVDGVAVRRKLDGALTLSWPTRSDADGRRHPLVHPIDDDARRDLEAQVLGALLAGGAP